LAAVATELVDADEVGVRSSSSFTGDEYKAAVARVPMSSPPFFSNSDGYRRGQSRRRWQRWEEGKEGGPSSPELRLTLAPVVRR
jgi:hypothetical protein